MPKRAQEVRRCPRLRISNGAPGGCRDAPTTCSSSPSQSLRLSSRYSMQYSKPLRIKRELPKVNTCIPDRAGQAGAGSQSPGRGMCACASPVGPELQLLHHILQGDQIPDVKGHRIAEGICCGICMAQWGPSSSSGLLCKAVLHQDPQLVLWACLASHDMQGVVDWHLKTGCRRQCQWAAHLD